jgi:hypothetical protein
MKTFIATALALCVGGCASATVSEPNACDTESTSFILPALPTIPAQYASVATCSQYSLNVPPVSANTSVDVSDAIAKLNSVAKNINVGVNSLTIDNTNGEFNWIGSMDIGVSTQDLPMMALATYAAPASGPGTTLDAKVEMSGADVPKYLGSGSATLTITLRAQDVSACQAMVLETLPSSVSTSVKLCVDVSGDFSKSL